MFQANSRIALRGSVTIRLQTDAKDDAVGNLLSYVMSQLPTERTPFR
jgi:hypothetical protein